MPTRSPLALARKAAVRGTGTVVARVPGLGRSDNRLVRAGVVDRARRALRRDRDPAAALAVLGPLLERTDAPVAAWTTAAAARQALGDLRGAQAAAQHATAAPGAGLDAFLLRRRISEALGDDADAEEALRLLAHRAPVDAREATATLRELARSARHLAETFVDTVGHTRPGDGTWVAQLRAEARLTHLHDTDRAQFDREADRVRTELGDGDRVVLRTLAGLDDWEAAAALAVTAPDAQLPARALRESAGRALKAGYAGCAAVLARRALDVDADDAALAVLHDAEDQVRLAAYGLDVGAPPPRGTPPAYAPQRAHVLAVLAQSLPLRSGGYATRSHGVLTGLRDLGWQPEAVTRLGFPYDSWPAGDRRTVAAADVVDGLAYHRVLGPATERRYPQHPLEGYVARLADAVQRHATEHRAALLHASSFHVNGLATTMAARRLGIPHLYEMRGLEDLMKVSRDPAYADTDRYRFTTRLELQNCLAADRVLVITEALRSEMAARGVPAEKMVVLPNGVHADQFQPRPRDRVLEAELGYAGRTVLGYVGSLVDYEGLELLLEAVAALAEHRDDLRLLVVGDGAHGRVLHALSARLRLDDVVTFTGRVPHEQVQRYLSLVDVTPFPRLPLPVCELISPIKPFEAMAMGKAAVVSSVAALTEIVRDGDTGLVFAKGDAADLARVLTRLLDDPGLRARLGERARTWVRAERDWSQVVKAADATYREVLDARLVP